MERGQSFARVTPAFDDGPLRRQWQLYPESLDQIAAPAVAAASSRGLID